MARDLPMPAFCVSACNLSTCFSCTSKYFFGFGVSPCLRFPKSTSGCEYSWAFDRHCLMERVLTPNVSAATFTPISYDRMAACSRSSIVNRRVRFGCRGSMLGREPVLQYRRRSRCRWRARQQCQLGFVCLLREFTETCSGRTNATARHQSRSELVPGQPGSLICRFH